VGIEPCGITFLGMVRLPKSVPPLYPVSAKKRVVELCDWFILIANMETCAAAMFPLNTISTITPLFVVVWNVSELGPVVGIIVDEGGRVKIRVLFGLDSCLGVRAGCTCVVLFSNNLFKELYV
jgi:hypothetical protein